MRGRIKLSNNKYVKTNQSGVLSEEGKEKNKLWEVGSGWVTTNMSKQTNLQEKQKRKIWFLDQKRGTLSICTGHTGSESNKCNRIDAVFEVDEATKMAGNVSDHSSAGPDEEDWNNKSEVSIDESLKKERR